MRTLIIALLVLLMASDTYSIPGRRRDSGQPLEDDRTLSPYFLVLSSGSETEQLPLKSTSAEVRIEGVIADVTVRQVYKNEGKTPIEAIYVFPGSTKAAVYGMTMKIGERVLVAEIQKKEEARAIYEKAKSEGRSASLLEQERPNVFQMSVANILPGDLITVELKYTELLVPESGVYSFIYPTVVGPRYSNKKADTARAEDKFVESPYQHEGEKPLYSFGINLQLNAGMPIDDISCNTHKVNISYDNADKEYAKIELDKSEESGGNGDFILNYKLAGGKIQSGLLLSEGTEKFFLLMLQPPKKVEEDAIPPREYVFVMDVSGSMWGFPLTTSKKMMKNLLSNLRPNDMFNVVLFAGGSEFLSCSSVPATKDNIDNAIKLVEFQQGGGGTELLPALKRVFNIPKQEGSSRTIVLLTDGYVDVEEEAFDLVTKNLNGGNFFAFGIGSAVNRYLIEGIARCGMGEPFIVTKPDQCKEQSEKFQNYIKSPVLTNVKIEFDGFNAYDIEPIAIPDVFQEKPVIIFGKWRDNPTGKIIIKGTSGKVELHTVVDVKKFATHDTSQALKYLWARHKIARLGDYNFIREDKKRVEEITNLGIQYNLLTKYTSFVAVDYLSRNKDSLKTVKQVLPMPEGVSDNAVGSGAMQYSALPAPTGKALSKSSNVNLGSGDADSKEVYINSSKIGVVNTQTGTINKAETNINLKEEEPEPDDFVPVDKEPSVDLKDLQKNIKFPENARRAGLEGMVIVRVLVRKNGKAGKCIITQTASDVLDQAAIEAIKKTSFTPAIQNGIPKLCWISIPIKFRLTEDVSQKTNKVNEKQQAIIEVEPIVPSEVEFKPTKQGTFKSNIDIEYREFAVGSGVAIAKGKKVTLQYKEYTDNCSCVNDTYKDKKPVTFVFGKQNSLPNTLVFGLSGMKACGKRLIYDSSKYRFYEVEVVKVE